MRDWVIVFDKKSGLIKVMSSEEYLSAPENLYFAIDDSSSEYKAQIKAKEIKSMGISRYVEAKVRSKVCEQ